MIILSQVAAVYWFTLCKPSHICHSVYPLNNPRRAAHFTDKKREAEKGCTTCSKLHIFRIDLQGQSGALGTGGWGVLEEHVFAGREKSANDAPWSCARKILGGLPATAPEPTPQCGEGAPDGQVRQSPTALHTDTHGPTVTTSRDPE